MKTRKLICLLLALVLAALCFAGCRGKKEEAAPEAPETAQTPEVTPEPAPKPEEPEQPEQPKEFVVIDEVPEGPSTFEDGGELVIEVPEGSEVGGD